MDYDFHPTEKYPEGKEDAEYERNLLQTPYDGVLSATCFRIPAQSSLYLPLRTKFPITVQLSFQRVNVFFHLLLSHWTLPLRTHRRHSIGRQTD